MRALAPAVLAALVVLPTSLFAQDVRQIVRLEAEPAEITLQAGETASFVVTAYDAAGQRIDVPFRYVAPRTALRVEDGRVTGLEAGDHQIVVTPLPTPGATWADERPPAVRIPVTVTWPAIARIRIDAEPGTLYAGTTLAHRASALHPDGSERPDTEIRWSTSDRNVATVDRFGNVTAERAGSVRVIAEAGGTRGEVAYTVRELPAVRLDITTSAQTVRTGDVVALAATPMARDGSVARDVPITWSVHYEPDDSVGRHAGAGGHVRAGRFVAETPGRYTILASAGPLHARQVVEVEPRHVVRPVREVGHARVDNVHTSDLWVWQGLDGRDYALTGTWGGDGVTYVWDVTDPANIVKTDSIRVDARTVNDVKVAPGGHYAAITREGASDRRNGVVIVDLADPAHPRIAAEYDEGLTGGVHNSFPMDDYLYVLSAGEKFLILDMSDIENPRYVGEYDHPGARIHDLHVHDGIAYTSQWGEGLVVVDVGNGRWGGTPELPRFVLSFPTPGGRTHAAFPYRSQSTDRFYVIAGDEILHRENRALGHQRGRSLGVVPFDPSTGEGGTPSMAAGYYHVIDFTDFENPELVAKYEVPEYGTHNLWVVDDVLYAAYYEGGMRAVDVSGELMGDLQRQGREIAVFKSHDPAGYIANAPMVWTAHPHRGKVFFSDWNSGLWTVEVEGLVSRDHCHRGNQEYTCR